MSTLPDRTALLAARTVPERRPVYLDPRVPAQVDLDGPALTIRVEGQAERLLPLRRISRIIANHHAEFATAALLALADRGISVLFVDGNGGVRGRLLGTPGERQELRQRFVDLLDRPDWRDRYADWLYAQRRIAILRLDKRLAMGLAAPNARSAAGWTAARARRFATRADADNSARWMEEQLYAWMVHHLQTLGFAAPSELAQDGWPDLAADLGGVLHWYGEPARLGWLARRARWSQRTGRPPAPIGRRDVVRVYQRHAARLAGFGREITNRLHRWLVELY